MKKVCIVFICVCIAFSFFCITSFFLKQNIGVQENLVSMLFLDFSIFITIGCLILTSSIVLIIIILIVYRKKRELVLINTDCVTSLSSIYKFKIEVSKKLEKALPNQYMIVSIDIDNFKYINELYGYEVGTKILQQMANMLKELVPQGAFLSRVYADEFIIFHNSMSSGDVFSLLKKMIKIENVIVGNDKTFLGIVHFSAGVYYIDDPKLSLVAMMDYASIARKEKKIEYGETLSFYTKEKSLSHEKNNRIVLRMQNALKEHEYKPFLQAIINLQTGEIIGAEVLVRWFYDDTIISPGEFIPLFEKNGFIYKLDLYMFEETCKLITNENILTKCNLKNLAVNLSRTTLLQENICDILLDITKRYEIEPSKIEIEVTETAFANDRKTLINAISKLRKLGFSIAIDDFGCEYSSLSYLQEISFDVIKIDKAFVDMLSTKKGAEFVEAIIDLLKKTECRLVVEGIESKENAIILKKLGCDFGQGFYFLKPIPVPEFIEKNGTTYSL